MISIGKLPCHSSTLFFQLVFIFFNFVVLCKRFVMTLSISHLPLFSYNLTIFFSNSFVCGTFDKLRQKEYVACRLVWQQDIIQAKTMGNHQNFRNRMMNHVCPQSGLLLLLLLLPAKLLLLLLLAKSIMSRCPPPLSDKLPSAKNGQILDLVSLQWSYFCATHFLSQNSTDCPGGFVLAKVMMSCWWRCPWLGGSTKAWIWHSSSHTSQPSATSSLSKFFCCRRCPWPNIS